MLLTACPHCGLAAMSALRKLALGPAAELRCRHCTLAVGVAVGPALLAFVPCLLVIVVVLAGWVREPALLIAGGAAAIVLTGAIYLWNVPLVRRELTRPAMVEAAQRAAGLNPRATSARN